MGIYTKITYIYKLSGTDPLDFIDSFSTNRSGFNDKIYAEWISFYNQLRPKR